MPHKSEDEIFKERQAREGKKGGDTTFKKHGSSFYARIARKRWAKRNKSKHAK